jgi:hypothetical protein
MIAHILIGTFAAIVIATGSALCGCSFVEVVASYLIGGFAAIALSLTTQFRAAPRSVPAAC